MMRKNRVRHQLAAAAAAAETPANVTRIVVLDKLRQIEQQDLNIMLVVSDEYLEQRINSRDTRRSTYSGHCKIVGSPNQFILGWSRVTQLISDIFD